jgi:hypothetical protein
VTFEHDRTYVAAFQKPWWVGVMVLHGLAQRLGIGLSGFWPKDHPNAPAITPPNAKPYTHLIAGRVEGATQTLELPAEIAWVAEVPVAASAQPFVIRRRTG